MNEHDAVEAAFNNGYEKGYADGKAKVMSKIAFPRFLVRPTELNKKDVDDILMQSPTITMDKDEIIPIYPYRWIPVTERLPKTIPCSAGTEYSEAVNVLTTGRKVLTAIWDGTDFIADAEFWDAEDEEITHWTPILLPLPEPPKGE